VRYETGRDSLGVTIVATEFRVPERNQKREEIDVMRSLSEIQAACEQAHVDQGSDWKNDKNIAEFAMLAREELPRLAGVLKQIVELAADTPDGKSDYAYGIREVKQQLTDILHVEGIRL
jgi:hypothetical protein